MTEAEMLAIKERAQAWLLRIPGVTAVGLTRKQVAGQFTETVAIIVYVERKRSLAEVPERERIPPVIDGVATDVVESPIPQLLQAVEPDDAQYDVLVAGISVSAGGGGHGTIGCFAETTADYPRGGGILVLVTSQHVLHDGSTSVEPSSAHSVGQPSSHSCCESCDFCDRIVGHDRVACVRSPQVDGGVAELKPGVQWSIRVADEPVPIIDLHRRLTVADIPFPVWKRGRTSRRTAGMVTDPNISGIARDQHGNIHRRYSNSLRIVGRGFAQTGDSGAPVMSDDHRLVGILASATANSGTACHIDDVEAQLKVKIRTAQNTAITDQTVPLPPEEELRGLTRGRGCLLPPPLPSDPPLTDEVILLRSPRARYQAVMQTRRGREFMHCLLGHRQEIRQLARRPRVIAAWRLFGGAAVTTAVSAGLRDDQIVVPTAFRGRHAAVCIDGLARVVRGYASAALRADIDRYLPDLLPLTGRTFREILRALDEASPDELSSERGR